MRGVFAVLLALVCIGMAGWVEHRPLLQFIADVWIVSDPIAPADAVAVFGGGLEDRPFAAASYYHQGLVKRILLSNVHVGPAEHLGALPTQVAATREILLKLGVPEHAIETFGDDLSNTHDEALALEVWAERTGVRSVIVPTELFSTRRTAWALHRIFRKDMVVVVVGLDPPTYRRNDWWLHEEGLISFQTEFFKYIYYRARY